MYFQFRFYFSLFAVVQFGILSAMQRKTDVGAMGGQMESGISSNHLSERW